MKISLVSLLLLFSILCSFFISKLTAQSTNPQKQLLNDTDSLISLSQKKTGIEKIEILEKVFERQIDTSPKDANQTALNILFLSKNINDKKTKAKVDKMQAIRHVFFTKMHDSTLFFTDKALPYFIKNKDSLSLLQLYRNLGTSYYYKNLLDSATHFYIKSTQIAEKLQDDEELMNLYGNLATVYQVIDEQTAQAYRIKSYEMSKKKGAKMQQVKLCFNMSTAYVTMKKLDSAIIFAEKAISISEEIGFDIGLHRSLTQLAICYYEQNENEKALPVIERAVKIQVNDPSFETTILYNYAGILKRNFFYQEAKQNLLKNISILEKRSDDISTKSDLQSSFFMLSSTYSFLKEPDSSDFYLRKAIATSKEIQTENITTNTSEIQTKYETEKKELAIQKLNQEAKIKDLELKNSYYLTIGAVVLSFVILIAIWIFFRQKNIIDTFEKQQAQLRWRRAQINPHFFFNVLSAIQMLVYEQQTEKVSKYITGFSYLMRQVLEGSNQEKVSLEEEIKFLTTYLTLEQLSLDFDFELLEQAQNENEDLEIDDIFIPTMLLQPFVENAIEHGLRKSTKEDKKIEIKFIEINQNTLQVSIKDNGAGRNQERKKQHISRALEITQDRKKLMKNAFDYEIIDHKDEEQNLGTEVVFTIKI
jgi:tetratricopeptide (TPR) repeat protein